MERKKTTSGRSDSSQRTTPTDAQVLDMLAEAEAEYEACVALSKISAHPVACREDLRTEVRLEDPHDSALVEGRSALMTERLRECVAEIAAHANCHLHR